jgi:hypothetical protein
LLRDGSITHCSTVGWQLGHQNVQHRGVEHVCESAPTDRETGPGGHPLDDLVEVRWIRITQVGPEMFHHLVLVSRCNGVEHRHVERGEPTRLESEFQTSPPLGFRCAWPGNPSTIHAEVAVHGHVVEVQQQMSADRIGSLQLLPGQIEMDDARMTSRAPLDTFAGEPLGDSSGEWADAVSSGLARCCHVSRP